MEFFPFECAQPSETLDERKEKENDGKENRRIIKAFLNICDVKKRESG